MLAHTESVTLAAPADAVHAFLANPRTLPVWAHVFCRAICRDGEHWRAETVAGPLVMRWHHDARAGTVDIVSADAGGAEDTAYLRVLPRPDGAELVFTFFRPDTMPDEVFDAQRWGLREELRTLRALAREGFAER